MTERVALKVVWLGFHEEGTPALRALCEESIDLVAVLTLPERALSKRAGHGEIQSVARANGIPLYEIDDINDDGLPILRRLKPDLLFVIGWSQVLSEEALSVPRVAALGAHASLLPHNRGGAPVNWALIRGETEGGNTLMRLVPSIDAGDVVAQRKFPITLFDSCASVYERVAETNRQMVLEALDMVRTNRFHPHPQPPTDEALLPRRRPCDGRIDWSLPAKSVYDFIRALARPYPGAFSYVAGNRCLIWKASLSIPDSWESASERGSIVAQQVSFDEASLGIWVQCGAGRVLVQEVQLEGTNEILLGRRLLEYFAEISRFDEHE